jgi:hypothetical protein
MSSQTLARTALAATLTPMPSRRTAPRRPTPIAPEDERLRDSGARWLVAHLLLNNARGSKVTLETLGSELAALIPERVVGTKVKRLDESILSRIENGRQGADDAQCRAMAILCQRAGVDIDPGWLMFGDDTKAPAPKSPLVASALLLRGGPSS